VPLPAATNHGNRRLPAPFERAPTRSYSEHPFLGCAAPRAIYYRSRDARAVPRGSPAPLQPPWSSLAQPRPRFRLFRLLFFLGCVSPRQQLWRSMRLLHTFACALAAALFLSFASAAPLSLSRDDRDEASVVDIMDGLLQQIGPAVAELGRLPDPHTSVTVLILTPESIPPSELCADTVQPISQELQSILSAATQKITERASQGQSLARSGAQTEEVAAMTAQLLWTVIPVVSNALISASQGDVGHTPYVSSSLQGVECVFVYISLVTRGCSADARLLSFHRSNAIVNVMKALIDTHDHKLDGLLIQFEPLIGDLLHLQYNQY
jgi:hypothetical protein